MKHIRYLDASHNNLTDPRPVATGMPSLLAVNLGNNSLVTTVDLSGSPHLQVLNLAHNKLTSFEPQEPPPPPPSLEDIERLRRVARKEARRLAKEAAKAAAAGRSRRAKARDDDDIEGEDAEEPATEELLLQEMLSKQQQEAASAARDSSGDVGSALLERFAAPGLLHLVANGNPLTSLQGLAEGGLPKLLRLEACAALPLRSLSSIGALAALRELIVTDCPQLTDLSGLHELPSLRVLVVDRCAVSSLRPLLSGKPLPAPPLAQEEGEEEEEGGGVAAPQEEGEQDPEGYDEAGGDGVHRGKWGGEEGGKWIPAELEDIAAELGLESDDEDERVAGGGQDDEEEEEGEGKSAEGASAKQLPAALRAPTPHARLTTAKGQHPLGQLRVLSLAGNPIESLAEVNRLRYLRGLASLNMRDTPAADSVGEEDFVTEVLIRLGGKRGQRMRLAAQLSYDAAAARVTSSAGRAAAEAGEEEASLEAAAACNVVARVNGTDVSAEAVLAARAERKERVAAWVTEWEGRKDARAEAAAQAREQEEAEEEEDSD